MDNLLKVENISKVIGGRRIVDDFSLDMKPGEIVGLLGPNGAGKTTIMRMLVGLIKASSGNITIGKYALNSEFLKAISKVGAVIETPQLYPYLTGYENLLLLSRINGKKYTNNIDEIVKLVQLEESIHHKVSTYSLGMRQRLGVAQALVHEPELVILDEPMNGLDPIGVKQLREYLRTIAKEKKVSILISSHILAEIELLCDRVVVLQNGKMVSEIKNDGSKKKVKEFKYQIKVDCLEGIDEILEDCLVEVNRKEQIISFISKEEKIPEYVKKFVAAGIGIYRIEYEKNTLEDEFLEVLKEAENA